MAPETFVLVVTSSGGDSYESVRIVYLAMSKEEISRHGENFLDSGLDRPDINAFLELPEIQDKLIRGPIGIFGSDLGEDQRAINRQVRELEGLAHLRASRSEPFRDILSRLAGPVLV